MTALIWSAKEGYTDNVKVLLDAGVDTSLADSSEMRALDWALKNGHGDVAGLPGAAR